MNAPTHIEVALAVLKHPRIKSGFVQHQVTLDHKRVMPVSGSPGAWHHTDKYSQRYRIVLYTDDGFAETTGELITAAREAFEKLRLNPPECVNAKPSDDSVRFDAWLDSLAERWTQRSDKGRSRTSGQEADFNLGMRRAYEQCAEDLSEMRRLFGS